MWKRLLLVTAVSAAMSSMAMAAPLTVGFSQVGSESGWRAAETNVAKSEAQKRGITLKIADGQQKQENQIKAVRGYKAPHRIAGRPSVVVPNRVQRQFTVVRANQV